MKNEFNLRRTIAAANVSLGKLGEATGIDEATLSRAQNGYRLSEEKRRKIAAALADALDRQTKEIRLAKRALARIVESSAVAA